MVRLRCSVGRVGLKNPLIAAAAEHMIDAKGVEAAIRAGAGASMMGSCQTVPVNESAPMRREGVAPSGLISMSAFSSSCVRHS